MGSFGAGLASVGGSIAQARELQRQQKMEEIKLALEKARLTTEQTYAQSRQAELDLERERLGVEKAREKRLGGPSVQQWKIVGNSMIAAGQNEDGTPFVKSIPLNREVALELKGLNDEIDGAQLPDQVKQSLRNRLSSALVEGDITGAAKDIRSVISSVNKQLGAPGSITSGEDKIPIWDPQNQRILWYQVPTQRYTQKLPPGATPSPLPGGSLGEPATGGLPEVPTPLTSSALDRSGASQKGVPAVPGRSQVPAKPSAPTTTMPPGSRLIGPAPPKGTTAAAKLKPEIDTGLQVLHASLFGSGGVPGLDSTLGVLDSWFSRKKLIQGGVGSIPNPDRLTITKQLDSEVIRSFTDEEAAFAYQLKRAISAINGLRGITGLPRSTQQLMESYAQELPNPIVTPNSKRARYQLSLIEREIQVAMANAVKTVAAGETGESGGTDQGNPLGLKFK